MRSHTLGFSIFDCQCRSDVIGLLYFTVPFTVANRSTNKQNKPKQIQQKLKLKIKTKTNSKFRMCGRVREEKQVFCVRGRTHFAHLPSISFRSVFYSLPYAMTQFSLQHTEFFIGFYCKMKWKKKSKPKLFDRLLSSEHRAYQCALLFKSNWPCRRWPIHWIR